MPEAPSSHLCPLGATAKAGCWKPVQRAGAYAFTVTGWTCAHATRPPEIGDRATLNGVSTPRFSAFRRSINFLAHEESAHNMG